MPSRTLAFVLILWASATAANAQAPSGGRDFCATAPADLLVAIDGSWTLQQGLTRMTVADLGMTIPLRPQRPVGVRLNYDGERRVVNVVAADLSDGIIMFPASPGQERLAAMMIAPASANTAGGCDWYALPTLFGTNVYTEASVTHVYDAKSQAVCRQHVYEAATEAVLGPYDPVDNPYGKTESALATSLSESVCDGDRPQGRFKMEMTLVLRFSSPNQGSGMLYFDGEQDGHQVSAVAPVTLRRR